MPELSPRYNFQDVEEKWLKVWKDGNAFHAAVDPSVKPFTVVIPPPNVTGILHMGHALNNTLQDILIRYKRMKGYQTLWMPGTDHAGIATQNVVEKQLAKEGKHRQDLGREEFIKRLWAWKQQYGDTIIHQLERLGSSCDWPRTRFTMDDAYSEAVKETFVRLYEKGLIYRGERIINWCPRCQTALSDEEAEHQERNGKIYYIRYPFKDDPSDGIIVATTRPETMLGDTAVAVNPKDERYSSKKGKELILPLSGRTVRIITDDFISLEFGTGAVKITPAHDPNDFAMGKRHNLEFINVMHPDGRINEKGGIYSGFDRFEARKKIIEELEKQGLLVKIEEHTHAVGHCYRCGTVVEPLLSKQWFVKMATLAVPALEAVKNNTIRIHPEHWGKIYTHWLENICDWCISRQIWWGHRVPVWYDRNGNAFVARNYEQALVQARAKHGKDVPLNQDEDVLDTWFSSWLWPFATLGWPKDNPDLKYFYPTDTLFTASEIIFFWVARMIMAGYEFMGKAPFTDVFIHGTVRDSKGRKMSKSLGNAIDPLEIIREYGADSLRFSLIINSGQDILISKEKFEIGRNFANKIWNASRLVLSNIDDKNKHVSIEPDPANLDLPSQWILSELNEIIEKIGQNIEQFKYSEAQNELIAFFWGAYCDWYLEMIKGRFQEDNIQRTAVYVLVRILKITHPFMPFITEEIYSFLQSPGGVLSTSNWPSVKKHFINPQEARKFLDFKLAVHALRNIRTFWNVKPQDAINVIIVPVHNKKVIFDQLRTDLIRFVKIKNLTIDSDALPAQNSATAFSGENKIYVPLAGLVDIVKEKNRMRMDIAQKQKAMDGLISRLNNTDFVAKAPQDVIVKEKDRLETLTNEIAQLNEVLANLF